MRTYGLIYGSTVLLCVLFAYIRLVRAGWAPLVVLRGLALTAGGGLAGAFILHYGLTFVPGFVTGFDGRWGGSTVLGMLVGGSIAATFHLRHHRIPWGRAFDVGCVPVPLGQAIGRLGCLSAGCCYGQPTESWMGMELANVAGQVAVRYPAQLMSSLANLLIFSSLFGLELVLRKKGRVGWPFPGFIFLLFVDLYCVKRFFMEMVRMEPHLLPWLTWAQLLSIVGFVTATITMLVLAAKTSSHEAHPAQ